MNKKGITTLLIGIIFIGITVLFYSNFSLYTEYNFSTSKYLIENNYIYNISSQTPIDLYKKYFDITNYKIKVENTTQYISNGSQTLILDKNDKLIYTFTNIVKGDIASDGIINDEDIRTFENYLSNNYQLNDYELECLDINNDNEISNEDLISLKNALNTGINDITLNNDNLTLQVGERYRLIGYANPNYGINTNLKWSSANESIASIDESGLLTPNNLGNTKIFVATQDNKIKKEINITVDNTIKLSSNNGSLFMNDPELAINIISLDYKGIKCQSSNPAISSCRIDNNTLYIKSLANGTSTITVTSPNYGSTTYNLTSYEDYLDFIPEYYCMPINRREIINLEYIYNDLEILNNKLTSNTSITNNQLYIQSLTTPGREELTFKDQNNNNKKMLIDIYNLNIPSIGAFIKKGTEKSADIIAQNTEELTCASPNTNIASCYIKDNRLYVTGHARGDVTLKITNTTTYNNKKYECGETIFLAVITD